MSEFITLTYYGSMYPKSLILRSRLESEGISCFIENEFGMYSRYARSAELQIMSSDLESAKPILIEMGFYNAENEIIQAGSIIPGFDSFTKGIPLLANLRLEMRLLVVIIIIASLFTTAIFIFFNATHP